MPTATDRFAKGHSVTGLALVTAFWCRYCYGATDSGAVIEPNDPSWDRLTKQAALAKTDPVATCKSDDDVIERFLAWKYVSMRWFYPLQSGMFVLAGKAAENLVGQSS